MSKVIVTGGAGFIGYHLCKRLLSEGHVVICVDNLLTGSQENISEFEQNINYKFINHDVSTPLPQELEAEYVFHMASPASPNVHSPKSYHALAYETMMVNTKGTDNVLKFAQSKNARVLYASTSEVYGDPLEHPQKETYRGNVSTTGPRSVYDEAKRFGETICAYYQRNGLDTRIVRIFNTYGPRMSREDGRMIIEFILNALNGSPIPIFGNGKQTRSLCFVDDTVDGIMKLMFSENASGEIVNIGSDEEHTVYEYAELIKELTQSASQIVLKEILPQDDPLKRRADITKAHELLSWAPQVSLREGIQKMLEYYSTPK